MNQQTEHSADEQAKKTKPDHKAKVIFLMIALVIGGGILLIQRRPPELPEGWSEDLPAALKQARLENRRLVIVFIAKPPSDTCRKLFDTTLAKPKNREAITDGRFIPVRQRIKPTKPSDVAKKYKVTHFPTTLILSPGGKELNRREDFIGELPFRDGFLNMRKLEPPPAD